MKIIKLENVANDRLREVRRQCKKEISLSLLSEIFQNLGGLQFYISEVIRDCFEVKK